MGARHRRRPLRVEADVKFVCIICRIEAPRADGRPVSDRQFPSWRCADAEACGARFLAAHR